MRPLTLSRILMKTAIPVVSLPLIFGAQLLLGYEVALFPLYLIPVVHTSWEFGWRWGMVAVLMAVALWTCAMTLTGQPFSNHGILIYNGLVRGVVYALGAIFIVLFKRTLNVHRERMEAMRALLNVCHGCGAVQGSDGEWVPMNRLAAKPRKFVCECPACARTTEADPGLQR